jgi:hypothetical protein
MFRVKQLNTLNSEDIDIMILQTVRNYKPNEGVTSQKKIESSATPLQKS